MSRAKWQGEWPTVPGLYWFYGWAFRPNSMYGVQGPGLHLVNVRRTANRGFCSYVTEGHFLYKAEGAYGKWLKADSPELPEIGPWMGEGQVSG